MKIHLLTDKNNDVRFVSKMLQDHEIDFIPHTLENSIQDIRNVIEDYSSDIFILVFNSYSIDVLDFISGIKQSYFVIVSPLKLDIKYKESGNIVILDMPIPEKEISAILRFTITQYQNQFKVKHLTDFQRFQDLYDHFPSGILIFDEKGSIIVANKALLTILGSPSLELTKKINALSFPPLVKSGVAEKFKQCLDTGKPIIFEGKYKSKWGKEAFVEFSLSPIELNNKVVGVVANIIDHSEEIEAREELRKQEEYLDLFFSQSLDGIFFFMLDEPVEWNDHTDKEKVLDYVFKHQRITKVNNAYIEQYGSSREEILGNTPEQLYKHDIAYARDLWKKLFDQGKLQTTTDERDSQGRQIWIEGDYIVLRDDENRIVGNFGIQRNITEKIREEKIKNLVYNISEAALSADNLIELYHSIQEELSAVLNARNFIIGLYNPEREIISVPLMLDSKDQFKEFSIKNTLTNLVIQKDSALLLSEKEILKLKDEGKTEIVGSLAKSWLGVPLKAEDKTIGVLILQDYDQYDAFSNEDVHLLEFISTQIASSIINKKQEEEIKKLSLSVEYSPTSVVITDADSNIEYVNRKFTQLTGYKSSEVVGKNPRILNSGKTPNETYVEMWETLHKGEHWQGEFLNKKKNGELFWEMATMSSLKNKLGKTTHYIAIKEDITERKNMEQDLRQAKEKAEESDKLKSAFLANLSHEIRTPMNGILGFSELLRENDLSDEEKNSYIDIINTNGQQLLNIINDIIIVSNLEVKQLKLSSSNFSLNQLLQSLYSTFNLEKQKLGKHHLEFRLINAFENQDVWLESDEGKLQQILSNLIRNAMKFTENGFVEYGVRSIHEQKIEFFVKDSGLGIAKNKQKIIFERFRQVEETTTRNFGGTGLGLAISKGLIELMGGEIGLKSELNKGSEFVFTIMVNSVEKKELPESIFKRSARLENKTILIVEDVKDNAFFLEEIIKASHANILYAENGVEAIDMTKEHPEIDLILMDIQMPFLNGIEATKTIRSFNKEVIIIAQTAYAVTGDREKALAAGCNDYISKPIRSKILQEKLKKYL